MSVLVYGISGEIDSKSIFYLVKKSSIPAFNLPSFPPALPALPIPKLPTLKAPSFSLSFNPPKYNLDLVDQFNNKKGISLPSLNLGFNLPSFPPALPSLPIPKLPSAPKVDLSLFSPFSGIKFPYNTIKVPSVKTSIIYKVE